MKTEEKFPYEVELVFPLKGLCSPPRGKSQLGEVMTWLDNNVGCEDIRWTHDVKILQIEEQRKLRQHMCGVFRFKLKEASEHFKIVWG